MKFPPMPIMAKLLTIVAILGLASGCARDFDLGLPDEADGAAVNEIDLPSSNGPSLSDHWHAAYGVYYCDAFLDPFDSDFDPDGIHTHADGLIHVHPFSAEVTGDKATMGVFFEAMEVVADDDGVQLPEGERIANGSGCFGQPASWQVYYWPTLVSDPFVFTEGFNEIRFRQNLEIFTIAFVPDGTDVPQPPSVE